MRLPGHLAGQAALGIALLVPIGATLDGQAGVQASRRPYSLDRAKASTVSISVSTVTGGKTGSGVVLTEGGLIATNAHVISGATAGRVRLETGEEFEIAGVLDFDPRLDIAIISIPGFGLPEALLGNSDSVAVGQRLLAIGAPLGLEWTVTDGILSAIRIEDGAKRLQISVPVSPGSSGGPVIAEDGRVIGLVVSGISGGRAQNLNFAVPINTIRGRLSGARSRQPTALSAMSYAAIQTTPGVTSSGAASVPIVNRELDLDFASLDGAQIYSEFKGEGQYRRRDRVMYSLGRTPSGGTRIDRFSIQEGRAQALMAAQDMHRDVLRTSFYLTNPSQSTTDYSRQSFVSNVTNESWSIAIAGSQYVVRDASGTREGETPMGVFPAELLGGVIAAMSDSSIRTTQSVWIFSQGAEGAREAIVTWNSTGKLRIRVPASGRVCEEGTLTRTIDVDVHFLTRRDGPTSTPTVVLASRPHLNVDRDIKCVYWPGLDSLAR
jgi:hypothetical protein